MASNLTKKRMQEIKEFVSLTRNTPPPNVPLNILHKGVIFTLFGITVGSLSIFAVNAIYKATLPIPEVFY